VLDRAVTFGGEEMTKPKAKTEAAKTSAWLQKILESEAGKQELLIGRMSSGKTKRVRREFPSALEACTKAGAFRWGYSSGYYDGVNGITELPPSARNKKEKTK